MIEIKYKITGVFPDEHQIGVRFFSDAIPESALVSAWEADGKTPKAYRTDYTITLPIPAPTGADLDAYIMRACPVAWFAIKEKIADKTINTSLDGIEIGVVKTVEMPTL